MTYFPGASRRRFCEHQEALRPFRVIGNMVLLGLLGPMGLLAGGWPIDGDCDCQRCDPRDVAELGESGA